MAQVEIELTEADLRKLVVEHLSEKLNIPLNENDVHIEVKTKENYRAKEWENGAFRARVTKSL